MKTIGTILFLVLLTVKSMGQTSIINVFKTNETATHVDVRFTWTISPSITFFSCNFQILHGALTEPSQVSVTQPSTRYTTNITTSGGLVLNCIVDDIPNAIQANTVSWTVRFRKVGPSPVCFGLGSVNECLNTTGDDFPATIPNCQIVIPVEWLNFQAKSNKNSVDLDWSTATEHNVQHFIVERSTDGQAFEQIGVSLPAKNTLAQNNYTTTDDKPLSGVSFYRIKEVSFDGKESFSVIKSVIFKENTAIFTVYPNPKSPAGPLSIQTNFNENYTFNLYDTTGKRLVTHLCKGATDLFDLNLTSGFYLYECATPSEKIVGKLIVTN